MEIIQSHLPTTFGKMMMKAPNSAYWRDFSYCYSVVGRQLARIDHFCDTPRKFWSESPTSVIHLPQNKFEMILRDELTSRESKGFVTSFMGYEATDFKFSETSSDLRLSRSPIVTADRVSTQSQVSSQQSAVSAPQSIRCDYLIAADGASSPTRTSLGIPLSGNPALQTLMNVHFTCEGLFQKLQPRSAMLYFVFNEHTVSVFVAHDPSKDEWVCQIPIFPPFRTPQVTSS
jgi:2-polyprenyl-6-methoxyphenol hydroxylase-like FAD-dependent oxidoreductase